MLGRLEAVREREAGCVCFETEMNRMVSSRELGGCPTNSPVVGIDALGEGQLRCGPLNHSNQRNL